MRQYVKIVAQVDMSRGMERESFISKWDAKSDNKAFVNTPKILQSSKELKSDGTSLAEEIYVL